MADSSKDTNNRAQPSCSDHPHGRCIHIDLGEHVLRAFLDGQLAIEVRPISGGRPPSGGKPGNPTTLGTFAIDPHRRYLRHRSSIYPPPHGGAPMNYALFFHDGEAIHEGNPQVLSHGCIHVDHAHAAPLFHWVGSHDVTVVITNSHAGHHPHHAHPAHHR